MSIAVKPHISMVFATGKRWQRPATIGRLHDVRRGVDEVFRLHTRGDEFMVLLHGPLDPVRLANKFRQELRRQGVSASGGLAYSTEIGYLPARVELRAQAEAACRQAKARGGDCVCVTALSSPSMSGQVEEEPTDLDAQSSAIPEPIADPPVLSARFQEARP